nr:MAG TPA: BLM protein [Caudoviricetes sp.]
MCCRSIGRYDIAVTARLPSLLTFCKLVDSIPYLRQNAV